MALGEELAGTVLVPGEAGYDEARAIFNAMIDRRPALIAQCEGEEDVRAALAHARENGLEVAVRSGGHSVIGACLSEGGLVVDLRRMNGVRVDPAARTATVQGGATWADVDRATQEHGLITVGGRVSTTGVAGLTLGGGSGWLERKYGLPCDALVSVRLVTADGRAVVAGEHENPDLFWALHGGGGNFGIATELVFALQPLPETTLGLVFWPPEAEAEVARAYRDLFDGGAPLELGGALAYISGPEEEFVPAELQNRLVVGTLAVHAGPEGEAREALAPLLALDPPAAWIEQMPYAELQSAIDDPPGYRNWWSAAHLRELSDPALAEFCRCAHEMVVPSPSQHLAFPWGGAVAAGAADWPLPHRGAPWVVHPLGLWPDPADDEQAIAWARGTREAMRPYSLESTYLNFDSDSEELVEQGFGGANLERLARVKAEYDPENVFHLHHNIKPLEPA